MDNKKILALLGLGIGGVLLLSSFSKGKTVVPDDEFDFDDVIDDNLPDYIDLFKGSQFLESTRLEIGGSYIITRFALSAQYPGMLMLRMKTPGMLQIGNSIKLHCDVTPTPSIAGIVNHTTEIQNILNIDGSEWLLTTTAWPATGYGQTLVNMLNTSTYKQGSKTKVKVHRAELLAFDTPAKPPIVILLPEHPVLSVTEYEPGKCTILTYDQNYRFNLVQPGDFIKISHATNPHYNKTVKVFAIGERENSPAFRSIVVVMDYMGENEKAGIIEII